ncbi:MAG: hypothetical protein ABIQ75_04840 [Flavobacteriales bacterium]
MSKAVFLIALILFSLDMCAQQDTVFMRHSKEWTADTLSYVTDTVVFPSGMMRHILTGTTILLQTNEQQNAKGFGLYFDKVTKSDCQHNGEEAYLSKDKINSIVSTDSTLTVDINVYDNCCFDFLCDLAVDSTGTLDLIYYGYGTSCSCRCCFGLTFDLSKMYFGEHEELKGVMLNGDRKTLKPIR